LTTRGPTAGASRVIQHIDRPRRLSLMEYLYYAGDDRFGALGVSTSSAEYRPRPGGPLPRLADAQALSVVVAKINARETLTEVEKRMMAAGGSFGGAKPKALIQIDSEQWVIKFYNNEPIDVPLIEHASMTLARKAGINTAVTVVVPLAGENAVAVRRFDRRQGRRIHSLSAGTALRAAHPCRSACGPWLPEPGAVAAPHRRDRGWRQSQRHARAVSQDGLQHPHRQHRRP